MSLKKKEIEDLKDIFEKILNQKGNKIENFELGTKNWDSLKHIQLILNIEKKFNVKIKTSEVYKLSSYKKIIEFLKKNN
jgi:acyl carrier protein